jgi:hypothetical protein
VSKTKTKRRVVAFLDTMLHVHYEPIDTLDWPGFLDADRGGLRI